MFQAYAANLWRRLGAPPAKINVGLALYGRSFSLSKKSENGVGAPTRAGGLPGKYTREEGYMSFYEVCTVKSMEFGITQNLFISRLFVCLWI